MFSCPIKYLHPILTNFLTSDMPLPCNLPEIQARFGDYKLVLPTAVSPMRKVPSHIRTPDYYKTSVPPAHSSGPHIRNKKEINSIRKSCRLAREVLDSLNPVVKEGVTTEDIDEYVHDLIISRGAFPSPLNYGGFPKSVCTSVNNILCHGVPDMRQLENGDIINIDVSVFYKGYHGDCCAMFLVGDVDKKGKQLVRVALEALNKAIEKCGPGEPFSQIGTTIQDHAKKHNYTVFRDFTGHGLGEEFHELPDVFHTHNSLPEVMRPGMIFTIEPILSQGSDRYGLLPNKQTFVTMDWARTAQWEHTLLITSTGVELLTAPDYTAPDCD